MAPFCRHKMQQSHTVVPAQPGFFTVEAITDNGHVVDTWLSPIIAWIVGVDADAPSDLGAYAIPVTPEGSAPNDAILYPSGRVVAPGAQEWPSLDSWLADQPGGVA